MSLFKINKGNINNYLTYFIYLFLSVILFYLKHNFILINYVSPKTL